MTNNTRTIRELEDGGYSFCSASEENVGKRRCKHIPGSVSFEVQVNKVDGRHSEIVIPEEFTNMTKQEKLAVVNKFVENLKPIDEETAEQIISEIRS
jgi:hypothetical protein